MKGPSGRERYLAARVLNALIREDYGGITTRIAHDGNGIALLLASGRAVRLSSGFPFQDFAVPVPSPGTADDAGTDEGPSLAEVLETLAAVADPADAPGVAAFVQECHETLAALELYHRHRGRVPARGPRPGLIYYETLAAGVDHPIYPTARCRLGLSADDLVGHAPEFAPAFALAWAAVPRERVTATVDPARFPWWPAPADVGLPGMISRTHVLFPVHPLTVPTLTGTSAAAEDLQITVAPKPHLTVRPTLSMRTVEVDERTHLKLPLPTSTLGRRNRRSIKPGTLRDGALAESLLREVLAREPQLRVSLTDEQRYGHAGHEYLAWLIRGLPEGEIVPVAALLAELPEDDPNSRKHRPRLVLHDLADRFHGGDVAALLRDYLTVLFEWNVTLFVRYGIALEAHQQNLSLLLHDGPMRLLIKDNDGLLASPDLLRTAGLKAPDFADERMFTDNPHALADVFVTITLHLAAMAVAHGALPHAAAGLLREVLSTVLDRFGDTPMAALLRARTLDATRLTGKSMLIAGTLVAKERTGARDINKFYGTTGPNYLRPHTTPTSDGIAPSCEADA